MIVAVGIDAVLVRDDLPELSKREEKKNSSINIKRCKVAGVNCNMHAWRMRDLPSCRPTARIVCNGIQKNPAVFRLFF